MLRITDGLYRDKHSRRYVHFNPNIFLGPWTWRLSNLQASQQPIPPDADINIITVLPIDDTRSDDGSQVNLFFNIDGLADVKDARTITQRRDKDIYKVNSKFNIGVRGLENVVGIAPVATSEFGDDVIIRFDINSLPSLVTRKNKFTVKGFNYNSKSIDNLSADKPLYVSSAGATTAIVSFDISQLDHA